MTAGIRAARAPGQESTIVPNFEPLFFVEGFLLAIINRSDAALRLDAALVRRTCVGTRDLFLCA